MKIKDLKEIMRQEWETHTKTENVPKGRLSFVVYDYKDGNGKMLIAVTIYGGYLGDYVTGCRRVSDGAHAFEFGRMRPCDNLDDAIDVCGEMMEI